MFWPFTVRINCSSDLKFFANSRPSASNFKSFSRTLEQFFLTVGQNNFDNKIPYLHFLYCAYVSYVSRKCIMHCKYIWWDYSGNWDTWKKCTLYKYLPKTLPCRSVDVTVNHCKSVLYLIVDIESSWCPQSNITLIYSGLL